MNHRKFSAAMIVACLVPPLLSAAQEATPLRPITHETLWMMKRVGVPGSVSRQSRTEATRVPKWG
jgi:hypothetical protein